MQIEQASTDLAEKYLAERFSFSLDVIVAQASIPCNYTASRSV